jgi:ABC-type sugar transport system permease subunit
MQLSKAAAASGRPGARLWDRARRLFRGRNLLILYAMIPLTIYALLIWVIPVGYGMIISSTDWSPMDLNPTTFVGLENYKEAFTSKLMGKAIVNSARYALFTVGLGVPLALVIAIMLNSISRGRGLFRLFYFLPVVTQVVAVGIVWREGLYQPRLGLLNAILRVVRDFLGLSFDLPRYLNDPAIALYCVGVMAVWRNLGYNVVLFMAGLSGIPRAYYDAAYIDGAGRLEAFRHVTLPLMKPTLVFVLVTGISGAMQVFTEIYVMTTSYASGAMMGTPAFSTLTLVPELYQRAFREWRFGYASAQAVIIFVIITAISLFLLRTGRTRWEY